MLLASGHRCLFQAAVRLTELEIIHTVMWKSVAVNTVACRNQTRGEAVLTKAGMRRV